jgi:hypothetical protein
MYYSDMPDPAPPSTPPSETTEMYLEALNKFDATVCEAIAVSQATARRMSSPHVGYGTHVFTRICVIAIALIRAVPKSRWVQSDFDHWDFGSVAGHCRSILEGQLLFSYIIKAPVSPEEWSARLNVMHLNDCTRRMTILEDVIGAEQRSGFAAQQTELRERLARNNWFLALDAKLQKRLLSGDMLTIPTRDKLLAEVGWERADFYGIWNMLSQYTHVLPLSFYRLEANGRGTGVENDTDRGYISMMLDLCEQALKQCTDRLVQEFPEAASVRKGTASRFSPGPNSNRP